MIEQQIADLKSYYNTLNTPQKKEFLDKLRVKISLEKVPKHKNELTKLLNHSIVAYNKELLAKKTAGR